MFSNEDLKAIEVILIREKATALSELRDTERLYGAYGDKRDSLVDRMSVARTRYETASRLLDTIKGQ